MVKLTDPSLEDGNKNIFMYQVKILGLELYGLLCLEWYLTKAMTGYVAVFNTEILTNMELKYSFLQYKKMNSFFFPKEFVSFYYWF